jgi:hypothetical protein
MRITCSCALLAALLAAPAARAAAAAAKAAPKSYEVPYRLTVPKHVLVRAKINGKGPFNFILDTGAPALFIAVPTAKKAGVKANANHWGTVDTFEIEGGVVLTRVPGRVETPFQLEGMNGMGLAGAEVHGLIGYNVLARYRMTIDFSRDKMIWTPLKYRPAAPAGMGARGGGQGGLEVFGTIMKLLGKFLGAKTSPDLALRGFLGVTVADGPEFPVVKGLLDKGPVGLAGLKVGDQIKKVAGRGVYSAEDVYREALKHRAGAAVKLTVVRGKETREITVTVGEGI